MIPEAISPRNVASARRLVTSRIDSGISRGGSSQALRSAPPGRSLGGTSSSSKTRKAKGTPSRDESYASQSVSPRRLRQGGPPTATTSAAKASSTPARQAVSPRLLRPGILPPAWDADARAMAKEVSIARREAQWVSNAAQMLKCADEMVLAQEAGPNCDSASEGLRCFLDDSRANRQRKFEEVLEGRLGSLRFIAEQRAALGRHLDSRQAILVEETDKVQSRRQQLHPEGLASRSARLAEVKAQLADVEQRCVQEVQARHVELDARQSEIRECVQAVRSVEEMCAWQMQALADATTTLGAAEAQAEKVQHEFALVEEHMREVEVREMSFHCMEAAWERTIVQCRWKRGEENGKSDVDVEVLRTMATDKMAAELLQSESYLRGLRALVETVVRNHGEVGPVEDDAAIQDSEAQLNGTGHVDEGAEGVSAASTAADLGDEGELPGSLPGSPVWSAGGSCASALVSLQLRPSTPDLPDFLDFLPPPRPVSPETPASPGAPQVMPLSPALPDSPPSATLPLPPPTLAEHPPMPESPPRMPDSPPLPPSPPLSPAFPVSPDDPVSPALPDPLMALPPLLPSPSYPSTVMPCSFALPRTQSPTLPGTPQLPHSRTHSRPMSPVMPGAPPTVMQRRMVSAPPGSPPGNSMGDGQLMLEVAKDANRMQMWTAEAFAMPLGGAASDRFVASSSTSTPIMSPRMMGRGTAVLGGESRRHTLQVVKGASSNSMGVASGATGSSAAAGSSNGCAASGVSSLAATPLVGNMGVASPTLPRRRLVAGSSVSCMPGSGQWTTASPARQPLQAVPAQQASTTVLLQAAGSTQASPASMRVAAPTLQPLASGGWSGGHAKPAWMQGPALGTASSSSTVGNVSVISGRPAASSVVASFGRRCMVPQSTVATAPMSILHVGAALSGHATPTLPRTAGGR